MSRLQQPLSTALLLAALWVAGIAVFSVIWWLPWLALTWTGVVGLLAAVMVGGMMFDLGRRSALLPQPSGSASADASFSCDLATEQEESLARMRTALRTVDDGAEEPTSSEGEMPTHLQRLSRNLHTKFSSISAQGGLKALAELDHQYQRLLPVLNEKRDTDPLGVSHIPLLAEEAYRQGLNVLKDAFELAATVESSERQRLEREAIVLEVEIAALEEAGNAGVRLTMKQETAASHRERLEIISQHEWRVEELLHQCRRCEASLDRTRMELAVIKADSSVERVSAVTESLRRTIEQARSVRDELTRLGL